MIRRCAVALFVLLLLGSTVMGATYREEVRLQCRVEKGGRLSIYNTTGNISVQTWDGDYVDIRAVKTTTRSARELDKVRIEVVNGSAARIRTVYLTHNASVGVNCAIRVPRDLALDEVEEVTGNIDLLDLYDVDRVKTITGNLTVRSAAGPTRAECTTGSIRLYLAKPKGDTVVKTITGQIDLYLAAELNAALDARVITGSITNDGLNLILREFSGQPTHLQGTLGTGGLMIRAEVVTGGVGVHVL